MSQILLCTLNARYIHASLGLRYLQANMGALESQTELCEFTLDNPAEEVTEKLLTHAPHIIGFGVYIWNAVQTLRVVQLVKQLAPDVMVVIGGPEVSYEIEEQEICQLADYVLPGQADVSFAELCESVIAGNPPDRKVQMALPINLDSLTLPYSRYTESDIAHRVVYVEASRGCPFKCEFCLSSLDKTATPFELDVFLQEMQMLMDRGARHFKFVDRTFNLKVDTCLAILEFFEQHIDKGLFLHFELIPDRLPKRLKEKLPVFPEGVLQFEIGIQSFDPTVQELVSRRQDMQKTRDNIRWLREHTRAHIHTDLIFGLPGESLRTFGDGFNQLCELGPQEIQVGILKRLRGTPIDRHTGPFEMVYQSTPPYRILQNNLVDFTTMQRMSRFARYWDLIANSGRFSNTLPLLLADNPFQRFLAFSDWLHTDTGQTHKISLQRLFALLHRGIPASNPTYATVDDVRDEILLKALASDFMASGHKGTPAFLADHVHPMTKKRAAGQSTIGRRQQRHLAV